MTTKKKQQRKHAKRRFKERFDIVLHKKLRLQIVSIIQKGKAKPVTKQSLRISLFEVTLGKVNMVVVYDRKRKEIVTGWLADTSKPPRKGEEDGK